MPDLVPVRRALISVSDKTEVIPFARALASRGVTLVSTGGTAQALREAGLDPIPIERITGVPEMLSGRVKTLHPAVHGALLAVRDDPEHARALQAHAIEPIDLVCINLYPFQQTVARPGVTGEEAIEHIDIGGPAMIRSAAKNFAYTAVVTSPRRYDRVISEMEASGGCTRLALRAELAAEAFAVTCEYDAAIAAYLARSGATPLPALLHLGYVKVGELRYGENPHQDAALYRDPAWTGPSVVSARQLHGKELSYNNIADAASALSAAIAIGATGAAGAVGACVVKHLNPCGAAVAPDALAAIDRALAGDPVAAYGGILAVGGTLDVRSAQRLAEEGVFLEVIVAPRFEPAALELLRARWTGVRLLETGAAGVTPSRVMEYRSIPGGLLVQTADTLDARPDGWVHAAGPPPTREQVAAARALETVVRFMASNAVAIGGVDGPSVRLFGAGQGQVDRVTACRLAVEKSRAAVRPGLDPVAVSDGFFPFPDGPAALIDAGVRMIVHPGGSKRDSETFDLCNQRGVCCVTTGIRRFRH